MNHPRAHRSRIDFLPVTLASLLLVACGSTDVEGGPDPDPDPDPTAEASDPSPDAGPDAGPDADPDPHSDVGIDRSGEPIEIAVIVDSPYSEEALARFPELVDAIDAAAGIELVVHAGDIKSGASLCSDGWYAEVHGLFMSFDDPLIYTPGDNEWTDCHRPSNGGYDPLERLEALRALFFAMPGVTLGERARSVRAQPRYPENQLWFEAGVAFATVHQVGSNNGLSPWYGGDESAEQRARRLDAFERRDAANAAWIEEAFALAEREDAAGFALFLHADMWSPSTRSEGGSMDGHQRLVETIATAAERFGRPVLMLGGDSHDYRVDAPVEWFELYGVPGPENLTQIVLDRSVEADIVWLRLSVDPDDSMVFRWQEEVAVP